MVCVVVTGGLASGKSTLLDYVIRNYNIAVIDADDIVRDLYCDDEIKNSFNQYFGEGVLSHGAMDTRFLQQRIMTSEVDRRFVESIIHPKVRLRLLQFKESHTRSYAMAVVPLVYETQSWPYYDATVVVDCPYTTQTTRAQQRGMTLDTIQQVLAVQATRLQRLSIADDVLYNTRDKWFYHRQIDALILEHRRRLK